MFVKCRKLTICIIIMLISILSICIVKNYHPTTIRNGVFDLSYWQEKGVITLSGKVEFYKGKLISKQELENGVKPDRLVGISSRTYDIFRGLSFETGSYRIHVTDVMPGQPLAIRVQPSSAVSGIYVDDKLMASYGEITENKAKPINFTIFDFIPLNDSFDIVLNISENTKYNNLSMQNALCLGTPAQITKFDRLLVGLDFVVLGFLVVIILYCSLFLITDKKIHFFVIDCVCLIQAFRVIIHGSYLFPYILPVIPLSTLSYLDCIFLIIVPSTWAYFIRNAVLTNIPKSFIHICFLFSILAFLAFIVIPFPYKWLIPTSSKILLALLNIFLLWKSFYLFTTRGIRTDTIICFAGLFFFLFCTFLDALDCIMHGNGLYEFGFLGFAICFLCLLFAFSYDYNRVEKERQKALEELNISNINRLELELNFLKSQIRPHFVNNALNTIINISRTDIEQARELLIQFSNYLRNCYLFVNLNSVITIEDELSHVEAYLSLEKARYGDSLSVRYIIDELDFDIPALLLQPLVENAIIHNSLTKNTPLLLVIYALKNDGSVKLGVRDNGKGFDADKLQLILTGQPQSHGVGIANINERLKKFYNTSLQISNLDTGGADVWMLIDYNGGTENVAGCDN